MSNNVGKLVRCFYYSEDGQIKSLKIGIIVADPPEHRWMVVHVDGLSENFYMHDVMFIV
jgi:hypothetical protein